MVKKEFTIATYHVDSDHDIILPGAIKMPEGKNVKILDHFDPSKPLGVVTGIKEIELKCVGLTKGLNSDKNVPTIQ